MKKGNSIIRQRAVSVSNDNYKCNIGDKLHENFILF